MKKTPELKDIEEQIAFLDEARTDSVVAFNNFNEKNESYYRDANQHLTLVSDSALKKNKFSYQQQLVEIQCKNCCA